jgi:hypothetical protein
MSALQKAFAAEMMVYTTSDPYGKTTYLEVVKDVRNPGSVLRIDSEVMEFQVSESIIAYMIKDKLFVVTDFSTFSKTNIADKVVSFKVSGGRLFYKQTVSSNLSTVYMVTDFKSLTKHRVVDNVISFDIVGR